MLTVCVHGAGKGRESGDGKGKEADGITVSFGKGRARFMSWRSFRATVKATLNLELISNGDEQAVQEGGKT